MSKLENRIRALFIILSVIFIAAACNKTNNSISPNPTPLPNIYKSGTMTIGGKTVNVQIADTDTLRTQGLSDRAMLGPDDGMVFIFPTPEKYSFWMKDMQFPLDFIWIREGIVTQITPNVPVQPNVPDNELTRYLPANPVDSMLEVNAGWAAFNGIKAGDTVVDQF